MGDRARFSITGGGGGGGGGAAFFGIFFRLLIKTVEVVLFDEGIFGDDSRLTLIFDGDLFIVDVGSILIEIFCAGLFEVICIGFFNGIGVVNFDGDGTASFFFDITFVVDDWMEGFISESILSFDDGRGLDNVESILNKYINREEENDCLTFNRAISIWIFDWYRFD